MLPLTLSLKNFMCYAGECALDLQGVHLACLSGNNGAGKSTLLDAITWALWGKSRAKSDRDLVTSGETAAEVVLTFDVAGETYRVARRWDGKRGLLELQARRGPGNEYRAASAPSMRETQMLVDTLVGMDYETFINSAFLLQGRADEFTIKPPGERKQILSAMLGLEQYGDYEQQAKKLALAAKTQQTHCAKRLAELAIEIAQRPVMEREARELRRRVRTLEEQLDDAGREKEAAWRNAERAKTLSDLVAELQSNVDDSTQRQASLTAQIEETETAMLRLESMLADKDEVMARCAKLQELRRELSRWDELLLEDMNLESEANRLLAEAEGNEKLLAQQSTTLDTEREKCAATVDQRDEVLKQAQSLEVASSDLTAAQKHRDVLREKAKSLSVQYAALNAENGRLRRDMGDVSSRMTTLQAAAAQCPTCEAPLDDDKRRVLLAQLEAEGKTMGDSHRANTAALRAIQKEEDRIVSEIDDLELTLQSESELFGSLAQCDRRLSEIDAARRRLDEIAQETANLLAQAKSEREEFARRKEALLEKREAVGYCGKIHAQVRRAIDELSDAEEAKSQIETAAARQEESAKLLATLDNSLAVAETALATTSAKLLAARDELAALSGANERLHEAENLVAALEGRLGAARDESGDAQARLAILEKQEEEHANLSRERHVTTEDAEDYSLLARAFGKTGIPALLIESVLPELEIEANALLDRLTDGRMQIRFESQRATQRGDVRETLDIHILDEGNSRSYELYSGGEKFRANFAIRVALSKLLARRSGVPLRVLFIDEGFGSQDTAGRSRLVESISAIQDDFDLVLVITHIDELREAFPAKINVAKTDRGSKFEVER